MGNKKTCIQSKTIFIKTFSPPIFCRRYWLVPSLPAVLVEDTLQEASASPLPFASPIKSEGGALQAPPPPVLRVRGRQVGAGTALGASAAEAARNLQRAIEQLCASAEMEDEHWQNPRLLDRDSLLSQLAIDLPPNRDVLTLDQLKALIHPVGNHPFNRI